MANTNINNNNNNNNNGGSASSSAPAIILLAIFWGFFFCFILSRSLKRCCVAVATVPYVIFYRFPRGCYKWWKRHRRVECESLLCSWQVSATLLFLHPQALLQEHLGECRYKEINCGWSPETSFEKVNNNNNNDDDDDDSTSVITIAGRTNNNSLGKNTDLENAGADAGDGNRNSSSRSRVTVNRLRYGNVAMQRIIPLSDAANSRDAFVATCGFRCERQLMRDHWKLHCSHLGCISFFDTLERKRIHEETDCGMLMTRCTVKFCEWTGIRNKLQRHVKINHGCPNESHGCDWVNLENTDVAKDAHLRNDCKFISCPYSLCPFKGKWSEIEPHWNSTCLFVNVKCKECDGFMGVREQLRRHVSEKHLAATIDEDGGDEDDVDDNSVNNPVKMKHDNDDTNGVKVKPNLKEKKKYEVNNYKCPICYELLENPMCLVPCLHTYCDQCYNMWRSSATTHTTCPLCRSEVEDVVKNVAMDEEVTRFINSFEVIKQTPSIPFTLGQHFQVQQHQLSQPAHQHLHLQMESSTQLLSHVHGEASTSASLSNNDDDDSQ